MIRIGATLLTITVLFSPIGSLFAAEQNQKEVLSQEDFERLGGFFSHQKSERMRIERSGQGRKEHLEAEASREQKRERARKEFIQNRKVETKEEREKKDLLKFYSDPEKIKRQQRVEDERRAFVQEQDQLRQKYSRRRPVAIEKELNLQPLDLDQLVAWQRRRVLSAPGRGGSTPSLPSPNFQTPPPDLSGGSPLPPPPPPEMFEDPNEAVFLEDGTPMDFPPLDPGAINNDFPPPPPPPESFPPPPPF